MVPAVLLSLAGEALSNQSRTVDLIKFNGKHWCCSGTWKVHIAAAARPPAVRPPARAFPSEVQRQRYVTLDLKHFLTL
jgi:hypothetical protein